MKLRIQEVVRGQRLRHVIQRRRWFRWRDVPGQDYPTRGQAIVAKYELERSHPGRQRQ